MSTAFLRFKLPQEEEEFFNAQNGGNYRYQLSEYDQWLRNELKHNDNLSEEKRAGLQEARDKLHEAMGDLPLI